MPKHIVQIIGDGRNGGGTINVLALVADMIASQARITFVSQEGSEALARARALGAAAVGIDFMSTRINFRAISRLKETVATLEPDVIHVHGARAGLPLSFALDAQRRFPVCYTLRGAHFVGKRQPMRYLAMRAERRCHRMADASIFVSQHDLELCASRRLVRARGQSLVIGNGIEIDEFPAPKPPDPRLVTFLGRLSFEKQPEIVLRVAREMAADGYRFQMIGGGPEAERLHRLARELRLGDAMAFLGELPRAIALERLNGSGALLLPSQWEGFPLAPIEAMALGIPTVAARVGGVPEVVEDGVTGRAVAGHAVADYVAALRAVTADGPSRRRMIEACRERAATRFSRRRVALDHLALYDELCARRR